MHNCKVKPTGHPLMNSSCSQTFYPAASFETGAGHIAELIFSNPFFNTTLQACQRGLLCTQEIHDQKWFFLP